MLEKRGKFPLLPLRFDQGTRFLFPVASQEPAKQTSAGKPGPQNRFPPAAMHKNSLNNPLLISHQSLGPARTWRPPSPLPQVPGRCHREAHGTAGSPGARRWARPGQSRADGRHTLSRPARHDSAQLSCNTFLRAQGWPHTTAGVRWDASSPSAPQKSSRVVASTQENPSHPPSTSINHAFHL